VTRAVVFAYHNVGVRCLKTLLAHGIDVALVITHDDLAQEQIWFDSVAATAADYGIATIAPLDPNSGEVVARVAGCRPDFLFSFYYRQLLKPPLLQLAARGALNVHGSLLPKFRGRAPVNWAIIHGATQTGATLHCMTEKPDAGDIVAQSAVPILPDDTAREVFDKVTVAAEIALHSALPSLLAGTAPRHAQDSAHATYFGGRKPEDGTIDWSQAALVIHNLVRAVAPPYPGARTRLRGRPARVLRSRVRDPAAPATKRPSLTLEGGEIVAHCGGGGVLAIRALEIDGAPVAAAALAAACGGTPVPLGD
jgi:methionyl-tRNA formyltransferase